MSVGTDSLGKSAVVSGGRGRDVVTVIPSAVQDVAVDLSRKRLEYLSKSGARSTAALRGFEDARAFARRVRLRGDGEDNRLRYGACVADVRAGAGDDQVRFPTWAAVTCSDPDERSGRLAGGAGDDRLWAGPYPDTILGGPGTDEALGRGGFDRCSAEAVYSCEVTFP